jgi:hypothetical protein
MQMDDGADAPAMTQPVTDGGAVAEASAAMLPVHLPDVGVEAGSEGSEAIRADEIAGLLAAIRRLESIVEEETAALATGRKIDFDDFSARKSRSMLEFVRLMRARMHLGSETVITDEIQRLRDKLERNRSILEMHYDAVREVATVIVRAIREAESDGTYSGRAAGDGK